MWLSCKKCRHFDAGACRVNLPLRKEVEFSSVLEAGSYCESYAPLAGGPGVTETAKEEDPPP